MKTIPLDIPPLVLAAMAAGLLVSPARATAGPLENAGFESGLAGWSAPARDGGMSQASPEAARSGAGGLLVSDGDEGNGSELFSSRIPATEGRTFRARFWGRIMQGRGLAVFLVFYDEAGAPLNAAKLGNEIPVMLDPRFPDWREYVVEGVAPAGAAAVGLRIHSVNREQVIAHLDEFSLEEVDVAAEARKNEAIAAEHLRPIPEEILAEWRANHPGLTLEVEDIAPVCSDFRVGFTLQTRGDRQYAAFYNPAREMTIAVRKAGEKTWRTRALPSRVGHDNHNFIAFGFDRQGCIHVAGNMHAQPLVYFRSTRSEEIESLEAVHKMTGVGEERVTYPRFYNLPDGRLVFSYRLGGSDDGKTLFNVYDEETHTWKRLFDAPLFDGEGRSNAYPIGLGPTLGPDGYYHLSWVWRDERFCETNHDLSYARSRNLLDWETIDGIPIALPLTTSTPGVIVDPVPVRGGIINGTGRIGCDAGRRLLITYHKYDDKGRTQMYVAIWQDGRWKITRATDWNYRWDFQGDGSIPFEIVIGPAEVVGGRLGAFIRHKVYGDGFYLLDAATLKLGGKVAGADMPWNYQPLPAVLQKPFSSFPLMQVNWAEDTGMPSPNSVSRLRWESLPTNRDKPHMASPPPTMLRLVTVRKVEP